MVRIRLRRAGSRNAPSYRLVVADSRAPRDGRFIENLGHYNPRRNPPEIVVNNERALYWLQVGAQPTETARSLLRQVGVMKAHDDARTGAGPSQVEEAPEEPAAPAEPAPADEDSESAGEAD